MKKSQVFLWTLYDFANSISVGVFSLYFSQWLVIDKKVPDLWFNMIFVGATLLLIFSAPIAGSVADKTNSKIKFLRYSTLLQFVFILAASCLHKLNKGSNQIDLLGQRQELTAMTKNAFIF
jgi:MFS-type transporter involved in bile tolerance (Atg22 family)